MYVLVHLTIIYYEIYMFALCSDGLCEETIDGVPIRKLFVDNLAERVCVIFTFPNSYAIYFNNAVMQALFNCSNFVTDNF